MLAKTKIAVIGAGKLGEALITGMMDAGVVKKDQFIATAAHRERVDLLQKKLGIKTTLSNGEAVRKARIVLLCVKPQVVEEVLRQIADDMTPKHLLISVAASVSTRFMENILVKPVPVIRAGSGAIPSASANGLYCNVTLRQPVLRPISAEFALRRSRVLCRRIDFYEFGERVRCP